MSGLYTLSPEVVHEGLFERGEPMHHARSHVRIDELGEGGVAKLTKAVGLEARERDERREDLGAAHSDAGHLALVWGDVGNLLRSKNLM